METKAYGIQSPESLAKEYGGNKQKIAKAVQLGILDPTAAVLAGMFIDRVRNAAQEEQGPQTTVAQQVLGGQPPAPPQGPPPGPPPGPPQAGLQAAAPPPMRMAYGGQVGVSNNQVPAPAMERGLDGIPIPDNMFDYAGGGMVAFGSGGDVKRFQAAGAVNLSQALPPFSFSSDVEFRKLLDSLARSGSYQQLDELLSKMPESDPRHAQIKQAANSARIATAFTPPSVQARPVPNPMGAGFTPPPMQTPPTPNVPGLTPATAPVERSGVYKAGQAAGRGLSGMSKLLSEGLVSTAPKAAGALSVLPYALESRDLNVGEEETLQGLARQRLRSLGYSDEQINKIPRNELTRAAASATQVVRQAEAPQADTTKKDTKAEEKAGVDTAVSEARRIMGAPKIAEIAEPPRMTVPQEKDMATEVEAARGLASTLLPMPADAYKSLNQILESDRETLAKQGYDFNMAKNLIAEKRADMEKIPEQRKEAASLRLLEAGLAIMGGTSPYAFVNIGKGASEAAKGFNEDMKEFRKLDREYRKELQQLQVMQNQETLMLTTEGRKRFDRIQDRVEQAKLKRADFAFNMGRDAVKDSREDKRAAEVANAALERVIYSTKADAASKQAQMENQTNIALAQIGAQERVAGKPAAEVQLIERIQNDPKFAKAYGEAMQARYAPRAEADLREEYTKNYLTLSKKYPTFEDYKRAMTQTGGTKGVDYKGRYGLE